MRRVEVTEFTVQATTMVSSGETLVIERDGKPIGFFVPVGAHDRAAGRVALGRLGVAVDRILEATGLSEEDLVRELAAGAAVS